ncbi:hypothetical protein [Rossellomorea sp. NPDC077527]|uniref:hypothetical protein n=1 Tax=Rossellomorea sp. NPDC077527 TaxID=3364510 RepID=UPI0037CBC32C
MRDYQARGYIFESVIWELIENFGYIGVEPTTLRGRGAFHQIDAYGFLRIPTPFIYPIRLLCEAKCYSKPIQLEHVRNYVGVIKDISENYIIGDLGERNIPNRYTDMGCYFSASGFTLPAQNYAWAHNIFIISFRDIPLLDSIINNIKRYVSSFSTKELNNKTKNEIVNGFWEKFHENSNDVNREYESSSIAIGVLDGVYPIAIVGNNNWIEELDKSLPLGEEEIVASKTLRHSTEIDTYFELKLSYGKLSFTLPNIISNKLIQRIDKSTAGQEIFYIDIPFISKRNNKDLRRIFKLIVNLDKKGEYMNLIESINTQVAEI